MPYVRRKIENIEQDKKVWIIGAKVVYIENSGGAIIAENKDDGVKEFEVIGVAEKNGNELKLYVLVTLNPKVL